VKRLAIVTLLFAACGPHVETPAPGGSQHLAQSDARRGVVGKWSVALTLDSLLDPRAFDQGGDTPMRPAGHPGEWLRGSLTITDSVSTRQDGTVLGRFSFPFEGWPGYHLTSGYARSKEISPALLGGNRLLIWFDRYGETVMNLTPGLIDYSWVMVTKPTGDTLTGYWYEESKRRDLAGGQARLVRIP
jgi:hypothetical protein